MNLSEIGSIWTLNTTNQAPAELEVVTVLRLIPLHLYPLTGHRGTPPVSLPSYTMSWLVSSIANSLKLDDGDDDNDSDDVNDGDSATGSVTVPATVSASITNAGGKRSSPDDQSQPLYPQIDSSLSSSPPGSSTPRRGVKDDLSELSKTLTRQFWGVAAFLAPPPQISDSVPANISSSEQNEQPGEDAAESAGIAGIRSDLSEIGGKFRTGIAKLSSNKAVSEFTKIASNLLQLGAEDDKSLLDFAQSGVVGVTEDVVAFARDISMHPETWLDFPLPDDDDDDDEDFDMSDDQLEHALAIEHLAPTLASLRIELCPGYLSEGSFWKIYFVLVHPRLSKEDALLLSTPQIMEARAMLTRESQSRAKSKPNNSRVDGASVNTTNSPFEERLPIPPSDKPETVPIELSAIDSVTSSQPGNVEMDKHSVTSTEIPMIDKAVVEESPINKSSNDSSTPTPFKGFNQKYEDDKDDWLKEEISEIVGVSGTSVPIANDEDVSFSDLEDDDDDDNDYVPSSYKRVTDSQDWVTLNSKSDNSGKDINNMKIDHSGKDQVSDLDIDDKEISGWLDFDDIDST
ncbi:hypothetical protein Dimus_014226 [Dionaea muscipula]